MPEVVVGLFALAILVLILLTALPRQREKARAVGCQHNLMNIGKALAQYSEGTGRLPTVAALGGRSPRPSPLAALLTELDLEDFRAPSTPGAQPNRRGGRPLAEVPVPGFVCASDSHALAGRFPAPISYRACTGDAPEGRNGAFAPGRLRWVEAIENADGLGYTAAFAERLVGDARDGSSAPCNYAAVPGPVDEALPQAPPDASWRGDAGSSWLAADWRSTLETHAITPFGTPSILAADGRSARMGTSSGHGQFVYVLLLDGSVRAYTAGIDPLVWRSLANTDDATVKAPAPVPVPVPVPDGAAAGGPGPPP